MKRVMTAVASVALVLSLAACDSGSTTRADSSISGMRPVVVEIEVPGRGLTSCVAWSHTITCDWEGQR